MKCRASPSAVAAAASSVRSVFRLRDFQLPQRTVERSNISTVTVYVF